MARKHTSTTAEQVSGLVPPSRWTCPKCGTMVGTLVPTYEPYCFGTKHRREAVKMTRMVAQ